MKKYLCAISLVLLSPLASAEQFCPSQLSTANDGRFSDNGDGTINDHATGRMWKKCSEGQSGITCVSGSATGMTWMQALQHVAAVNADALAGTNTYQHFGYSDWRLPNIKELASIAELNCILPAASATYFPALPYDQSHWSATPAPSNYTWAIDFSYGFDAPSNKAGTGYVLLLRN